MKKSLTEEAQRIMEIMGKMNLTELNVRYMDQLLDKISKSGMESLSDYEKESLQKLSRGEDTKEPEIHSLGKSENTLRFTTTDQNNGQPLARPKDAGQTFGKAALKNAYIHGEAAELAGYDLPVFIDGDLSQLDKPVEEQEIRMLTNKGEYECVSEVGEDDGRQVYYLVLKKPEGDESDFDDEVMGLNENMSQYNVFNDTEMSINEGNAFVGAAKKAKEDGKDSFELNGKKYKVTVKKTEQY